MNRDELGALLRLLVDSGKLTASAAAALVRRFDLGDLATAELPVPLASLPGPLSTQELAVAMKDVAVRLTPKQATGFLMSATKPATTETPPEVKQFLRQRLRDHFRLDYERRVTEITRAMAQGGDVGAWHDIMAKEQRAYIARMSTAGHGRALALSELDTVNQLAIQQQSYLYRYAGDVSARRLAGEPYSENYLVARSLLYQGAGWTAYWQGAEHAQTLDKEGYIVHYDSVDDGSTCSRCLDAQNRGPYPAGTSYPRPGSDTCEGRGRCRCSLRFEFDMTKWKELVA